MVGTAEDQRKSQRSSAIAAVVIVVALLLVWPLSAGAADWLNETSAPAVGDTNARWVEADSWDTVTFNMDSTALKDSGGFDSRYVWENASGDTLYSNITHTAGIITTTLEATAGNSTGNITNDLSWSSALPYYEIYFDYTAKQAYEDNIVMIWLQIDGITNGQDKARSVALTAGGVTFYSLSISASDADNDVDKNITINVNDLRTAIINDANNGNTAYFKLKITGALHTGVTFAGSAMYTWNCVKLVNRDDPLLIAGIIASVTAAIGAFVVTPRYKMPFMKSNNTGRKGGF